MNHRSIELDPRKSTNVFGASPAASPRLAAKPPLYPAEQELNLLLLGKGTVGRELLEQIAGQAGWLHRRHGIALRLVGVADSERLLFNEGGLDPARAIEHLRAQPAGKGEGRFDEALSLLGELPTPVLIDCTAAEEMEALYRAAFTQGAHVVAANKKPLAIGWEDREALFAKATQHRVSYQYETTVGASLPVIDTLIHLVRTGDRVRRIEASLSGTLGFLSNELSAGASLVSAVRQAKALGYTEPDPREDLSGADVMRKALILARELGLPLELSDVELVPFIPAELFREEPLEEFYRRLEGYEETFREKLAQWKEAGRSLRYLAVIDPSLHCSGEAAVRVGPEAVLAAHPAATLQGSESMVSFATERHQGLPLVVRGAGAGGAVTASGVLTDILRIAHAPSRR